MTNDRKCIICGDGRAKKLYEQKFYKISDCGILNGYDVVVCDNCGFGYASDIPGQDEFDKYYREMSKYENAERSGTESDDDRSRFQEIAGIIKHYMPDLDAGILEIGCSTGALLSSLKKAGYTNLTGLDPSPVCAKIAKELHGITVLTDTVSTMSSRSRPSKMIILVAVLEHLCDPKSMMKKLREELPPGGLLFIEVPDVNRFSEMFSAPFQQFSIEHINFFSERSLLNMMLSNGFHKIFSRQDVRRARESTEPVISAVFKKEDGFNGRFEKDDETEKSLIEYIELSKRTDDNLNRKIEGLIAKDGGIIVWGAGTQALRLLASGKFSKVRINAFIDSNPNYHGKALNGVKIIPPEALKGRTEPVLISSKIYQEEISAQIRNVLKCKNDIIFLYK